MPFHTIVVIVIVILIFLRMISNSKESSYTPTSNTPSKPRNTASSNISRGSSGMVREIDGRRVIGWELYHKRHIHSNPDALKRHTPPHYDWEKLPSMLTQRLSEYLAPSYGIVDTYEEHVVFRLVFDMYSRGKALEKEKDYSTALDCYLHILFSVVPLGDSYYVRPAILLERFKQYEAALIVCKMRYRYLRTDLRGASDDSKKEAYAAWRKRENRLKEKLKKAQSATV